MNGRWFRLTLRPAAALLALIASAASLSAGQTPSAPTPRTSDGHPDLTGMWRAGRAGGGRFIERAEGDGGTAVLIPSRRCAPNQKGRPDGGCTIETNFNNDLELTNRSQANRPLYKPEYWDKVQELDYNTNFDDPIMQCVPVGIPRVGPPTAITSLPGGLVFMYSATPGSVTGGFVTHDYRLVSTNGRPRNPDHIPGYWGEAIGRWEGDTLVVETTGFHDVTWIGRAGYFHSFQLRVIERFRRDGNTLHYQVTVEDPEVLAEPWTMEPRTLTLETNPNAVFSIPEGPPCEVVDDGIPGRIRT